MKIFTLSAVCVLVYGLLIALSGTTSLPGSLDERAFLTPEDRQAAVTAAYRAGDPLPVATASIQDWNRPARAARASDSQSAEALEAGSRPIRLFGILFILVWIWVSVKLLSLD